MKGVESPIRAAFVQDKAGREAGFYQQWHKGIGPVSGGLCGGTGEG